MNLVSKCCLTIFEIVNELYIAVGAGFIGMVILVHHGYKTNQLIRTLSVVSISLGSLVYAFQSTNESKKPSRKQIIFISGCDSGLGFSLALHAQHVGFTVIAGFLNLDSAGAQEIKRIAKEIKQIELDITKNESVFVAVETVRKFIEKSNCELYAVVNNAAVMVFGEFEWQTDRLIDQQILVNLHGTMNLTRAFIPLMRKHRGRMIFVTSHCSYACLPGLSVYGATKAGVKAFSDGLRVELSKYGIKVIQFTPGSFVTQSNIMAKHSSHVQEMHQNFNEEQHRFYDDYFQRYNAQLLGLQPPKFPMKISNPSLYKTFEEALLHQNPHSSYKIEPFRYAFYHLLFKFSPVSIRDYFIVKFMSMPDYDVKQDW